METSSQFGPNSAVLFSNLTSRSRVPQTVRQRRCQGRPLGEAPLRPGRVCAAAPSSAGDRGEAASHPPPPLLPLPGGAQKDRGTWRLVFVDAMVGDPRGPLQTRPARRPAAAPSSRSRVTAANLAEAGGSETPSGSPSSRAANPAGTPGASRPSAQNFRNLEPLGLWSRLWPGHFRFVIRTRANQSPRMRFATNELSRKENRKPRCGSQPKRLCGILE